ncbi:MAG: EFR1 family ferrodoxin [Spirochaetes bacterium]|nr:EFR1 family ferrodoxin [Spirochaetota bacterium]
MQRIESVVLYYFTGTGNALKAARWICDEAGRRGLSWELHAIDRELRPDASVLSAHTLAGFLYPTHGFNAAPAMLKFIARFPRARGVPAFLLNTRAGGKFFRWVTPGLSGLAQLLPMLLLLMKGFSLCGGLPLDMPSNWVSLHPAYGRRWIEFIVTRCEGVTRKFTGEILAGKRRFGKALASLPVDLAISPIAVLYYLIGRFCLAKTFIYSHNCTMCGICERNCPVGAITIRNGRPYWSFRCESCMRCIANCPEKAVQACHSFLAIIVAVAQVPFTLMIVRELPLLGPLNYPFVRTLVNGYCTLAVTFALYAVLQRLLLFRPVNLFFTYTSLTRYWGTYRAPGITMNDYRTDSLSRRHDTAAPPGVRRNGDHSNR